VSDNVNHPAHYNQYKGFEVIDITEQMNFNLGNVVKYVMRAGFKDPEKTVEDLEKARWYLDKEINRLKDEAHRAKVKEHLAAGGTVITDDDLAAPYGVPPRDPA